MAPTPFQMRVGIGAAVVVAGVIGALALQGRLVRVVESYSTGVGEVDDAPVETVLVDAQPPKELLAEFEPAVQHQFDQILGRSVVDLETPLQPGEVRFGFNRLNTFMKLDNHVVRVLPSRAALIGNGTEPLSPDSWEPKLFSGMVGKKADAAREKDIFSQYAKEAYPYFKAGFREPIRWRAEIGVMEARPVVLKTEQCLSCHSKNNLGDVAGILIGRISHEEAEKAIELNSRFSGTNKSQRESTSNSEQQSLVSH